jgi:hypothetical protein
MTDRETMQQALEALEKTQSEGYNLPGTAIREAITALRETLAQPEQEPVAWICYGAPGKRDIDFEESDINELPIGTHLYTTPPAAQPEQEVLCRFCHDKKGCWAWQCYSCGEIDDVQKPALPAAQRPWQGLTEWEREAIAHACGAMGSEWLVFIEAVEKALKEKNR